MLSSQNTYIDHAMFMQDVFNKSAGMRALRCTEINDHADTCRVNPATGLDECDSDEVSRDTAYPVFHYWMQRSGKHYRCVIDGGQAEDQNRSSGYFQCPLLLDKKKCEGAFKYHNGRSLCQWHEEEKEKEKSNVIVSVISSTMANMFSAPKRSRIYEVPESPCRSVCDVDWDKCDNVLCDLTGDYKCRPRRLPDNFRSARIAGNTASTGIGVVREDGTRSGEDSDFKAGELVYLKDPTAAKLVDTSWWITRQFRYLRGMSAKSLGMRGRVLASGSKPQEGDSSEKLVTVLFEHEVGGSQPKQLEMKPSALMHGNEAKLVYRGANGTAGSGFVQSSSLFRDPALWSCGYLGNSMPSESAKVAVKNFHPDIVMKNPFTWLHVKIVNVDDPSDVRWNAVFTYKKPTTRVSATAQPNIGATAHWYDSDFYKYPSFGGSSVLQKMGQMLTAAKSSLVSSVGGKQNLNPATSNKDLRREWSSKVARALSIFTNSYKKKSPAHHLPHYQRVVPFRPLCGPRKAGKRRLFDVSITTDGMALHGMSVPHYDFSLRQLYDYVKKSLWLDMTEESGGIKGQLALSGADEIRRARGTSNSARNGEVLPPDEQDELLKDRKPDKWTKKPVFDMLAGQMIAVPTALRRKLATAGFVGQMSPQSAFYHVFPRGREVGGVNHPGAFGAGGEPMYYGEHAGIEVVTPL